MDTAATIDADANDDFIWSPNDITTATVSASDWTNGFSVTGLPGSSMTAEVLSQ